jgi:cell division protein FtsI/penicillin-binding protein 2
MSFGQGMSLTMVQVASAFCSLINGGNYYKPTVIAGIIDGSGKYIENKQSVFSNPISKSTADTLREMTHVVREYTTYGVDKPGYYIGGKTGTAQVLRDGVYVNDESIASYLGYGGSEDISRYVIMVQISGDHKPLMGPDARLIFNDISNWMLDYLKIQPKG